MLRSGPGALCTNGEISRLGRSRVSAAVRWVQPIARVSGAGALQSWAPDYPFLVSLRYDGSREEI